MVRTAKIRRIVICILILSLLIIGISGCNKNNSTQINEDNDIKEIVVEFGVNNDAVEMKQFGGLVLTCSASEFLKSFSYSDIVSVEFEGKDSLRVPVCGEYDDVSPGELVLRANPNDNKVIININYGQLGIQLGFIEINAYSNEYKYRIIPNAFPSSVTIRLIEAGGYADRIAVGKLKSSNSREAYPNLIDEEFANFREVICGDIKANRLYRSSSPIDNSIGRNEYVDDLIQSKGIVSIINMTDDEEEGTQFPGYNETNYSTHTVGFLKMSLAFRTQEFNQSIAECLRFIVNNDGPYLVHCVLGKDRTGFLCALLEALSGASIDEIKTDYVKTYTNLFDVQNEMQTSINQNTLNVIGNIIIENMSYAYNTELSAENIGNKTVDYILSIGITQNEIATIRSKLTE